ncbi:MAG TPA: VOC family protein [Woeseiaceae bacterium]
MRIEPYLFFNGRAEEAIDFYREALGAELQMLMRFSESPDPVPEGMLPPGFENKVMHSCITVGGGSVMISDGDGSAGPAFSGFALSLEADDGEQLRSWFDALSEGGRIKMPVGKTFFAELFGMVTDKFGVDWMLIVPADMPQG